MYHQHFPVLETVLQKIRDIKINSDSNRDRISSCINTVLNGDWGNDEQSMKRGQLIVNLKIGERLGNSIYLAVLKYEESIDERVAYLKEKIKNEESKKKRLEEKL